MRKAFLNRTKTARSFFYGFVFVLAFSFVAPAQTEQVGKNSPTETKSVARVTQIDETAIRNLLKPNGKPLLVNFWATWCEPCREEFPDLVKIDTDYRGKIDLITISLDFADEINTTVPKFLAEMKAEMPAFLLLTQDESAVITSIRKDWSGGLPFTILYNEKGEMTYFKEGKFKTDVLRGEIDKLLPKPQN